MTDYENYMNAANAAFNEYYCSTLRNTPPEADKPHITNIARSIMMTRDGLDSGGSFVQSIIENNLSASVGRADSVCVQCLPFFVYCKLHVHPRH
jgi:hypothetical protein